MTKVVQENVMFLLREDWHIQDILQEAALNDYELSYGQAVQIMDVIAKYFDANIGINWIVIGEAIKFVMDNEPERDRLKKL